MSHPTVKDAYDAIASAFSNRRREPWPPMIGFLEELRRARVLDIGCGNGRGLVAAISMGCEGIGVDISPAQIEEARRSLRSKGLRAELVEADMRAIPIPDGHVEACMMIASLHHLKNREERVSALREALRTVRPGGRLLVSVWSWDQERFRGRHLGRLRGERSLDDSDGPLPGDFLVPWKDGVRTLRFYHLYGPGEIEEEAAIAGWTISRSYFDGRNHWLECEATRRTVLM